MRCIAVVAVIGFLVPGLVHAQSVRGKVVDDETGQPVHQVQLVVLDSTDRAIENRLSEAGSFLFDVPGSGRYRLRVQALGYAQLLTEAITVAPSTAVTVEIRLRQQALALAPLQVIAERIEPPFMRDVRYRQRMGFGKLLTREDLEARFGSRLDDVIRDTGMWIEYVRHGNREIPLVTGRPSAERAFHGVPCYAALYLNGNRVFPTAMRPSGVDEYGVIDWGPLDKIDDLFSFKPQDVEAIEVYRSRSETPAEWASPMSECGVVAVWLRSGYERTLAESGPLHSPSVALLIGAGAQRLSGDFAPGDGIAGGAALEWPVTRRFSALLRLTRSTHSLAPSTTEGLMRGKSPGMYDITPETRQLTFYALSLEPRLLLLPGARVSPMVAARLTAARRGFSVDNPSAPDRPRGFTSIGAGIGASVGVQMRLTNGVALIAEAARDRISLGSYRFLDTATKRTSTTWSATSFHAGLVVDLQARPRAR